MIIKSMHDTLRKLNNGKSSYYWEGWTINKFTPHPAACFSPKGAFRNNQYGYIETFEVNNKGQWVVS